MIGWILYKKQEHEFSPDADYCVIRLKEAAKEKGITLKFFTPSQFELIISKTDKKSILIDNKPHPLPDFVLPRMGSDTTYFSGAILRQLASLGVYVCNSAESIELVKDKLHSQQILAYSNLPTPKTILLKFPVNTELVKKELGFPVIIKNISGQKGSGIYLSESEDKFNDLMDLIHSNSPNANIILQEFIKASHGMDIRVFIVGGKVIGHMKRSSQGDTFKANVSRGGKVEQIELTSEIEWLATETARLMNLDIAGIDLLIDKEGYQICEANSAPGFKGLEQIYGNTIAEQILDYIMIRLGKHSN